MERPNTPFCNGNNVLNNFWYAEFLAHYINKSNKTGEYQLDEFDDKLIENNYEECSYPPPPTQKNKLMTLGETM